VKRPLPGLPPRFAAWRILHDVRHGVPFDVALRRAIRDLEPEDRRLAHELAAGVFRSRSRLDQSLGTVVERGIASVRPDTLDVLRLGAFQLSQLDRIPAHAAVQTTVGVARRLGGRRIAGFVNAVLRRLVAIPPSGDSTRDVGTDLAQAHSHPGWLVDRWLARFGPGETARLLAYNNARPPLVIQPARWNRSALEDALGTAGIGFRPAPYDAGLVVEARKPGLLPGFVEGGFVVQDPAQRLVTRYFAPDPGSLVYDACAAPGGKSVALAAVAGTVVAADRTSIRIRRLVETIGRAGPGRVFPIQADALHPPVRPVGAIVLDVPCLGTGAFARNPDARWRVTPAALERLATQAARFLGAAAPLVAPGGLLLFATCSLEPEENEDQVERFLRDHPRFRREPSASVPAELLTAAGDLTLLPQRTGTDGAFAARLRRLPD
jgi:16S rRNA (cytosine967-C5)-methyltransferase